MRWRHWSYILSVLHVEDLTFQTRCHICQTRKQPSSREHRVVLVRVGSRPSSMRGYNVLATALDATQSLTGSPRLVLVDGDIGKKETAAKCVEAAIKHFGTIDVLVNNAGIYYTKPFTEFTTPLVDVRQFNSFQPGLLRRGNGLSRRAARLIRRFAMKRTESTISRRLLVMAGKAPSPGIAEIGELPMTAITRDHGDHARSCCFRSPPPIARCCLPGTRPTHRRAGAASASRFARFPIPGSRSRRTRRSRE